MSTPLVVAKDVRKSFQHMGRTLDVLRGIDLSIDEAEMIGVVGQSGAGKSTFLHCIGTLDVVTSGSLKIAGQELTTMSGALASGSAHRAKRSPVSASINTTVASSASESPRSVQLGKFDAPGSSPGTNVSSVEFGLNPSLRFHSAMSIATPAVLTGAPSDGKCTRTPVDV